MTRTTPYIVKQTDRALETAITFIQARQASEISYGRNGRSAGCVVTHPTFQERWLKVKWWAAGEMIRLAWDGELLAIDLHGVSKPRIYGFFDWEAIGICYRATMMSVAPAFVSKSRLLDHAPVLESQWWKQLENAITTIQAKQTDRTYIEYGRFARILKERFGLKVKLPLTSWQTAHGDLHWANLTAPEFSILDWETWGGAPYGFDVAYLHVFSLTQPEILTKLKDVFPVVVAKPEYDIALLYIAAEVMGALNIEGRSEEHRIALKREAERVLAERRFAQFCE